MFPDGRINTKKRLLDSDIVGRDYVNYVGLGGLMSNEIEVPLERR